MTRTSWLAALGVMLALGGAAGAAEKPGQARCPSVRADERPNRRKAVTYPVADLVVPIGSGESELAPFLCRKFPELTGKRSPGQTCEEVLIALLTKTIAPASWCEVGGKGTIQFFPLGLALVVNQTQDVQEQIADLLERLRAEQEREDKEYRLEAKLVETLGTCGPCGPCKERSWPRVTFVRGQPIHVMSKSTVAVNEGSVRDLVPSGTCSLGPAVYRGFIQAFAPAGFFPSSADPQETGVPTETLNVGASLKAKLIALPGEVLRLDVSVEISELTEATRDGLRVEGRSTRLVRKIKSGDTVKLVLSRDEKGEEHSWVELTVTELESPEKSGEGGFPGAVKPAPRERDVIYPGELPPLPR